MEDRCPMCGLTFTPEIKKFDLTLPNDLIAETCGMCWMTVNIADKLDTIITILKENQDGRPQ